MMNINTFIIFLELDNYEIINDLLMLYDLKMLMI